MTLMGGPIDTRRSPTEVNKLAERRGLEWFRRNCLHTVPFPYPGFGREVYPGFLQLSGFMAMNLDRHVNAHLDMFNHLVNGDGDSAEKHRDFYDEYLAVMDLDAAYYMQTIETVFVRHALPKGEMMHRGELVDLDGDPQLRPDDRRRREGRHFRRRPDLGRAGALRQHPGGEEAALPADWKSAITAFSTARASARKSRRASANSLRQRREARDAQRRPQVRREAPDGGRLATERGSHPVFSAADATKGPGATADSIRLGSGGNARCMTGKFSTETLSIGTGLLGAFQAEKPPLSRRETSISTSALIYIVLTGLTAELYPNKKLCIGCSPTSGPVHPDAFPFNSSISRCSV